MQGWLPTSQTRGPRSPAVSLPLPGVPTLFRPEIWGAAPPAHYDGPTPDKFTAWLHAGACASSEVAKEKAGELKSEAVCPYQSLPEIRGSPYTALGQPLSLRPLLKGLKVFPLSLGLLRLTVGPGA